MELRQLRTFRAVATLNSFNQAAEVLGYAQSTVSQHIKALEDELDTRLFIRSGRRIAPTKAGELLLQHAQRILDIEEEIRAELMDQQEPQGTLVLRIPETISTYYLPSILNTFHGIFPKVGLSLNRCAYYGLEEELRSGITDLAFLITDTYHAANLEAEVLAQLPLVMVAHPDNPLTALSLVSVQGIISEPILLPREDCSYRMLLEKDLTAGKTAPDLVLDFNSIEAIKQCIVEGVGITIIPEIAVRQEIANGLLSVLPWEGTALEAANLLMIWHRNKWMPPTLRAFMDITRQIVAAPYRVPHT